MGTCRGVLRKVLKIKGVRNENSFFNRSFVRLPGCYSGSMEQPCRITHTLSPEQIALVQKGLRYQMHHALGVVRK